MEVRRRRMVDHFDKVKLTYDFPTEKPDVPAAMKSWHNKPIAKVLRQHVPGSNLVLEMGSWLGKSALDIMSIDPDVKLICLDGWMDSIKNQYNQKFRHEKDLMYRTFLSNVWTHRDRIAPMRSSMINGMKWLHKNGVQPNVVYHDFTTDRKTNYHAVETSLKLFPDAVIVGDYWTNKAVRLSVKEVCKKHSRKWNFKDTAWWIEKKQS